MLGVSRASVNNYARGKTKFEPSAEQVGVLNGLVVEQAERFEAAAKGLAGV